ncbi:MAG: hypothetical protein V1871_06185 [Planctomycetota bacterium]
MKFISKLSRRERLFLYISAIIVLLFMVDKFIFEMMLQKINSIESTVDSTRTGLNEDRRLLSYKDKIIKETEIYSKYLEKEESPEVKLQELMNTLAIQSELTINEIKPVSSKDANKYLIELKAEGKMKNLVAFLYNLSLVQSLLKVEKMDLGPKTPKSETLNIYLIISKTIIF